MAETDQNSKRTPSSMFHSEKHPSHSKCLGCFQKIYRFFFEKKIDMIQEAIKKGDLEKIKYYHIVKKLNFNQYNKLGDTPLLLAARAGKFDILKYILKKVPGIIRQDKSFLGDTALMIATFNNDFPMVRYLVEEEKFDPNCRDNKGFTPFIAACANGYIELMAYFRFVAKVDVNIRGFDKQSAAHRAAYYGNLQVLIILENYTEIRLNQPDKRGNLPVHYAAMNNHFSVVRFLMSKDSKMLQKRNKAGISPEVIIKKNLDKVKKLKSPVEVSLDEIRDYIRDQKLKPFDLDHYRRRQDKKFSRMRMQARGTEKGGFDGEGGRLGRSDDSDEEKSLENSPKEPKIERSPSPQKLPLIKKARTRINENGIESEEDSEDDDDNQERPEMVEIKPRNRFQNA